MGSRKSSSLFTGLFVLLAAAGLFLLFGAFPGAGEVLIAAEQNQEKILFQESFEDTSWASNGWYDNPAIETDTREREHEGPPTGRACLWHWREEGDRLPGGKGGRVLFTPTESVTLSFYIKHSGCWEWTGRGWHPHEFLFMTTVDDSLMGPAYTHLTLYVEVVDGKPRLGIQDSRNIDTGRLGENLVGVTENRAVAGGNGDSDGYGPGDSYKSGESYRNGKHWETEKVYFSDEEGSPFYKNDWHHVKAHFKLNSVKNGKGVADGVLRYWYDDKLVMDYQDVMFRTGKHPEMKINQFQMLPYYGPGVTHKQKIWIDDIKITH
ncbi:MAG: hypothetical protein U9N45_04250 [Gemmatimonadota bacterium]|nr:hypothetical protein [Gemmatimonadota bacterium]